MNQEPAQPSAADDLPSASDDQPSADDDLPPQRSNAHSDPWHGLSDFEEE